MKYSSRILGLHCGGQRRRRLYHEGATVFHWKPEPISNSPLQRYRSDENTSYILEMDAVRLCWSCSRIHSGPVLL